MNALRWFLAVGVVFAGVGFAVLITLANQFRKSFGASENNLLISLIPVCLSLGIAWWIVHQPSHRTPESLAYPVLLVEDDKISEVCLNAEELTLRPENQDHVIEQQFHLIDAHGARFRIRKYRLTERKPSTLSRVFNATIYSIKRFKVTFEPTADGVLTRAQILTQLRDREWSLPAAADSLSLADLYTAYRADRFREYGLSRDRIPETPNSQ